MGAPGFEQPGDPLLIKRELPPDYLRPADALVLKPVELRRVDEEEIARFRFGQPARFGQIFGVAAPPVGDMETALAASRSYRFPASPIPFAANRLRFSQ